MNFQFPCAEVLNIADRRIITVSAFPVLFGVFSHKSRGNLEKIKHLDSSIGSLIACQPATLTHDFLPVRINTG